MKAKRNTKSYFIVPRVFFYSFLVIFILTAILALAATFFDIGNISENHKGILFSSLILPVTTCMIALFKASFKIKVTETKWGDFLIQSLRAVLLKGIAPLHSIEQRFLQVLVDDFQLKREGNGVHLEVRFDNNVPAIWTDRGKREFKSRFIEHSGVDLDEIQYELDQVLIAGDITEYKHEEKRCPFRYASGGALPIVTIGETQYYCLIYREISPVGWNIANGGCDSREELLNPSLAIERELNEELIIFDPEKKIQYFFNKFYDLPDHNMVREYLRNQQFPPGYYEFSETVNALTQFEKGPDILSVTVDGGGSNTVKDCFVNINATDTSIELDKIANIKVSKDAIFIDGEIAQYYPTLEIVNAPIGLFKKDEFDAKIRAGSHRYIPNVFFQNARRFPLNTIITSSGKVDPALEESIIESALIERIDGFINRQAIMPELLKEFNERREQGEIYDLCPATRSIISRFWQDVRRNG